jgi:hypothetical protein
MLWVAADKVLIEYAATPLPFNVPVPSVVVPSRKVTVPVGVPAPPELTVAVNVTDWLKFAGLGEAVNATLVLPCCTTRLTAEEVLGSKVALPP